MKLYSDEDMLERCKDYQPIPLHLEQKVLHQNEREDRISILNGVIKSPYKIGQPVSNVMMYATQLPFNIPIDPDDFLKAYNNLVDKELAKQNIIIEDELLERYSDLNITKEKKIPDEEDIRRRRESQLLGKQTISQRVRRSDEKMKDEIKKLEDEDEDQKFGEL